MIAKPNFQCLCGKLDRRRNAQTRGKVRQAVDMCILDISKVCLYEFHHEYMSPMYHDKCKIMYTDNLIYHIEYDDVYKNMKCDIVRFDTSDYLADNVYGMPLANKKVSGLTKNENNDAIMTKFVGLRAKMYAVRVWQERH